MFNINFKYVDLIKTRKVRKIYRVNVIYSNADLKDCFFFVYYKTSWRKYEFRNTRAFQLHWKKQLSKKLIDYLLTLEYYYWFSCNVNQVEGINFEKKIWEKFITYSHSPISINIREYNI